MFGRGVVCLYVLRPIRSTNANIEGSDFETKCPKATAPGKCSVSLEQEDDCAIMLNGYEKSQKLCKIFCFAESYGWKEVVA